MLYICPFCASSEYDIFKKNQGLRDSEDLVRDFYKCRKCDTIYPCPRTELDENLKGFSSGAKGIDLNDPTQPVSESDFLIKTLKRYRKQYNIKKALDIGSYTGRFCYVLESLGIETYGLEPQDKAVEYARSKGLKVYDGFFPEQIPSELNDAKYDLISCNESIYYFVDLKQALLKIYEMLLEKGILFIKFHQGNSYYYSSGGSLFSRYGDYVQSIPTARSLFQCLNSIGFEVKEISSVPDQYLHVLFGIDKDRVPLIHKVFNRLYRRFFLDKDKWIELADRLIIVACKGVE